ncbi:hypothetical protein CSOJ01_07043 [Colletotrichum sojae]|uniref:Uncharacterized protein n=1 Tax=Colletotrichum sojae TaxID=2175907 RepID=A0A8H6JA36_9PEZI|nr:hypothetical protein CSOJ01_07043 [Colletotrichum sojae]
MASNRIETARLTSSIPNRHKKAWFSGVVEEAKAPAKPSRGNCLSLDRLFTEHGKIRGCVCVFSGDGPDVEASKQHDVEASFAGL